MRKDSRQSPHQSVSAMENVLVCDVLTITTIGATVARLRPTLKVRCSTLHSTTWNRAHNIVSTKKYMNPSIVHLLPYNVADTIWTKTGRARVPWDWSTKIISFTCSCGSRVSGKILSWCRWGKTANNQGYWRHMAMMMLTCIHFCSRGNRDHFDLSEQHDHA